jgi:ATP-dependent DNA helicase RecQ
MTTDEQTALEEPAPARATPAQAEAGSAEGPRPAALATLQEVFGYRDFRPLQWEIVETLLAGQDAFVLMPTGGGKSLCYQLPALLREGWTVVVSPLIALMKDQVDALEALGVAATFVNSSLERDEIGRRQAAVSRGALKLLYVAPERLMQPGFLALLARRPPALFAIDEAHCISEWGHDFRPEYRELRRLRALFPNSTLAAFTATATRRVQADILAQLGLARAATFRGSFNRANLYYRVEPKKDGYRQLAGFLRQRGGVSGIVYCQRRADADSLAARLRADGFAATAYHAGLEADERRARQEAFVRDDVRIVVATIAFGMGIDKPDVRFVVHFDLPKNLEGYYQESGRAGRDGDPADCLLLYNYADAIKQEHFIRQKPDQERTVAASQLRRMVNWAQSAFCRRRALLAYFDETLEQQPGRCCDLCTERAALQAASHGAGAAEADGPAAWPGPAGLAGSAAGVPVDPDRAAEPPVDADLAADAPGASPSPFGAPAQALEDCTVPAQMLLSCVVRTGQRFGLNHLIGILRGSRDQQILRLGHDQLSTYGIGRDRSRAEWERLAEGLLRQDVVRREVEQFNALKLTPRGRLVLQGQDRVFLVAEQPTPAEPTRAARPADDSDQPFDQALFERLRTLRKRLADEQGVPPYVVFHDATLREMCRRLPSSEAAFRSLPGVGEHKTSRYGPAFLQAIREHLTAAP